MFAFSLLLSLYISPLSPSCSFPVVKRFQSYADPEESSAGPVGTEEDGVALPLGETTLICNIGIPIIVVCCKVSVYHVIVCVFVIMWLCGICTCVDIYCTKHACNDIILRLYLSTCMYTHTHIHTQTCVSLTL